MGIERLLALWQDQGNKHETPVPEVYVVHQGEQASRFAFRAAEALRDGGFAVHYHCGGGSFKSQMKKADASGALLAAIVGDDEAAANQITLKHLRDEAEQRRVAFDELADAVGTWLYDWDEDDGNL
jgi:histidyl-tRNA synthetase